MKALLQLLRRPLLHVAGLSFFVNLLLLVPALFTLQVFDRVLNSQSRETLLVLVLGAAIALLLMMALDYLRARLQGVAGNLVARRDIEALQRSAAGATHYLEASPRDSHELCISTIALLKFMRCGSNPFKLLVAARYPAFGLVWVKMDGNLHIAQTEYATF